MGSYVATHIRFKLKAETPSDIVLFARALFDDAFITPLDKYKNPAFDSYMTPDVQKLLTQKYISKFRGPENRLGIDNVMVDLNRMVNQTSAYHEAMCVSTATDDLQFQSFASCSELSFDKMIAVNFFGGLLPWLDMNDGDIVMRSVYESDQRERIVFLTLPLTEIGIGDGITYDEYDDRHPWGTDKGEEIYIPDMNRNRLLVTGKLENTAVELFSF